MIIELNDYQVANLRAAIEAAGYNTWDPNKESHVPRNPLYVLNNGDWIGEIYQKLPTVAYQPNASPQVLARAADQFDSTAQTARYLGSTLGTMLAASKDFLDIVRAKVEELGKKL